MSTQDETPLATRQLQPAEGAPRARRRPRPAPHDVQEVGVDQVTALYLALRARDYDEIADFVRLEPDGIRERVHAMLKQIGGEPPAGLPPEDQAIVMDYVLQQLPEDQREHQHALDVLRRSAPARAWADAMVAELRQLAPPERYFPEVKKPPRPEGKRAQRRPKGAPPDRGALPPAMPRSGGGVRTRRVLSIALQLLVLAMVLVAYWLVVTHGEPLQKL
jgi:hypothetical protein